MTAGSRGNLELNVMLPVMARNLLSSIDLLTAACNSLTHDCVARFTVDEDRLREAASRSPAIATALNAELGYDRVERIVRTAISNGSTDSRRCARRWCRRCALRPSRRSRRGRARSRRRRRRGALRSSVASQRVCRAAVPGKVRYARLSVCRTHRSSTGRRRRHRRLGNCHARRRNRPAAAPDGALRDRVGDAGADRGVRRRQWHRRSCARHRGDGRRSARTARRGRRGHGGRGEGDRTGTRSATGVVRRGGAGHRRPPARAVGRSRRGRCPGGSGGSRARCGARSARS